MGRTHHIICEVKTVDFWGCNRYKPSYFPSRRGWVETWGNISHSLVVFIYCLFPAILANWVRCSFRIPWSVWCSMGHQGLVSGKETSASNYCREGKCLSSIINSQTQQSATLTQTNHWANQQVGKPTNPHTNIPLSQSAGRKTYQPSHKLPLSQ